MKKLLVVMMMSALCLPVFAKDDCGGDKRPFKDGRTHFAVHCKKVAQESEFKKAHREHKAKMEGCSCTTGGNHVTVLHAVLTNNCCTLKVFFKAGEAGCLSAL